MAVILFLVPISLNFMTYYGMPKDALESTFAFFYPSAEQIALEIKIMQGSYLDQIVKIGKCHRTSNHCMIEIFWRTSILMLLGMILYRKGILSADKSIGYYKKMIWIGFVPGLILSIIGLDQVYASEWSGAYVMNIGANYKFLSGLFMASSYIGLLIWIYKKGIFKKLKNRLQVQGAWHLLTT